MTKLRVRDIVTVSSVRAANTRIMHKELATGRFVDAFPPKGLDVVRVRSDIAKAGKVAMSKYLKAKA